MGGSWRASTPSRPTTPSSWFPTRRDAPRWPPDRPRTAGSASPDPQYLNAVMDVDMAAALLVTDAQTPHGCGLASDAVAHIAAGPTPGRPVRLHSGPRCRTPRPSPGAVGWRCPWPTIDLDAITAFDLYSCFPSRGGGLPPPLGVEPERRPSIDGGRGPPLPRGPGNNYVTHVIGAARCPACGTAADADPPRERQRLLPHQARGRGVHLPASDRSSRADRRRPGPRRCRCCTGARRWRRRRGWSSRGVHRPLRRRRQPWRRHRAGRGRRPTHARGRGRCVDRRAAAG